MMINPADDEINLLLPLAFGIVVCCFVLVISLTVWILHKTKAVKFANISNLFDVFRALILTILGCFAFSLFFGFIVALIEIIKNNFLK